MLLRALHVESRHFMQPHSSSLVRRPPVLIFGAGWTIWAIGDIQAHVHAVFSGEFITKPETTRSDVLLLFKVFKVIP